MNLDVKCRYCKTTHNNSTCPSCGAPRRDSIYSDKPICPENIIVSEDTAWMSRTIGTGAK